jgi:hypothetical protein
MMNKLIAAAALTVVAMAAHADPIGGVAANQDPTSFLTLSSSNVTGGALYTGGSVDYAAAPANTAPPVSTQGTWLASGSGNFNNGGGAATVSLGAGTSFVSFLWGSPDTYNVLTITTTVGSFSYVATDFLSSGVVLGNQTFASYIGFTTTGAEKIVSVTFGNRANETAFEASNFLVTTPPVPEPETYALLLAGLGVVGFMARRRKSVHEKSQIPS